MRQEELNKCWSNVLDEGQGAAQLFMLPKMYDAVEMKGQVAPALEQEVENYTTLAKAFFCGRENFNYRYFIGIRILKRKDTFVQKLLYTKRALKNFLLRTAGFNEPIISANELEDAAKRELVVYSNLTKHIRIKAVETEDISWLIARGFYRGLGEPPGLGDWQPSLSYPREILRLTEGQVSHCSARVLQIQQFYCGEHKKSFVSFLTVANFPKKRSLKDWVYILSTLPFPVELCLNIRKQIKNMTEQGAKLYDTEVLVAVAATDKKVLNLRVQMLKDLYGSIKVQLILPYGEQWSSFNAFLPGNAVRLNDYVHYLSTEQLAIGLFAVSSFSGDSAGHFIGMASHNSKSVFLDSRKPRSINNFSAIFIGDKGMGKSVAAKSLIYQVLLRGGRGLIFEAEDTFLEWRTTLANFDDWATLICLEDSGLNGILDPFCGLVEKEEIIKEAAVVKKIFTLLAGATIGTYEANMINKAVDFVVKHEARPSMYKVLVSLSKGVKAKKEAKYEQLQQMVLLLEDLALSAQGRLFFAEEEAKPLEFKKSLTILHLGHLVTLVETDVELKLTKALFLGLGNLCLKFYASMDERFSAILFEELDYLETMDEGKLILNALCNAASKAKSAFYGTTRRVGNSIDLQKFSNCFLYKHTDQKEREKIVNQLNLREKRVDELTTLEPREVLFVNDKRAVTKVKIKVLDERLIKIFGT
jgi:hypothetical protein